MLSDNDHLTDIGLDNKIDESTMSEAIALI